MAAFEADKKYSVTVADAYKAESGSGTKGLGFKLRCDALDNDIWHTEWITPKTMENFLKRMKEFGLDPEIFESEEFWEDPAVILVGKKAEIETVLDTYDGKSRVKVKWLNGRDRKVSASSAFAALFAKQTLTTPFD